MKKLSLFDIWQLHIFYVSAYWFPAARASRRLHFLINQLLYLCLHSSEFMPAAAARNHGLHKLFARKCLGRFN